MTTVQPARGALLDAALDYAACGWRVFPCRTRGKVPAIRSAHAAGYRCRGECGQHGHGVLDATTDPAVIRAWWAAFPTANIGLATGAPGPDVVDIDVKAGAPGMASFGYLRDAGLLRGAAAVVTTPSGGLHLYFRGTDQGNGSMPRHGVDFRGAGGYVLAPPSYVLDVEHGYADAYRLDEHRVPAAVVDFAAIRVFLEPPRPRQPTRPGSSDGRHLVEWLAAQTEGNRNGGLFWAACQALQAGAQERVFDDLAAVAVASGLSASEADRTIASAIKRMGATR